MINTILNTKPNIILLMCDQMRGDCMGIAGHPDVKTPYLDSLAAQGTYFPNAYSASPSCIPARVALFTGMEQKNHGRVGYEDGNDWNYKNMLPQVLSNGGYHTEAIGKLHVHPPLRRCGFNNLALHDGYIGFYRNPNKPYREHQEASDSYIRWLKNRHGQMSDVNDTGLECNSFVVKPWIYDEMSHPTAWTVSESIEFLQKRDPDIPFFMMTSFVRPHPPFDAPSDYLNMYQYNQLREPHSGDWANHDDAKEDYLNLYDSPFGTDDKQVQHLAMSGYYACITHMDHQIGRLLQAIEREKILEDSIILFVSDHGELLFDHGLFRKVQPYQGSVNIPLIARIGKNLIPNQRQNPICYDVIELRDLMPTILEMAHIPIPDTVDGQSFLPSLLGRPGFHRDYLHGEHSGGQLSNHYIVTKHDKYIWFSQTGVEQYFDLGSDPNELCNLITDSSYQDRIKKLKDYLIKELDGREEGYSDGKKLFTGKTPLALLKNIVSVEQES